MGPFETQVEASLSEVSALDINAKPEYVDDFIAGWEAAKKEWSPRDPTLDHSDAEWSFRRAYPKHGSWYISGFDAYVDTKRGAYNTQNAKIAKRLRLREAAIGPMQNDGKVFLFTIFAEDRSEFRTLDKAIRRAVDTHGSVILAYTTYSKSDLALTVYVMESSAMFAKDQLARWIEKQGVGVTESKLKCNGLAEANLSAIGNIRVIDRRQRCHEATHGENRRGGRERIYRSGTRTLYGRLVNAFHNEEEIQTPVRLPWESGADPEYE